jgi:hypothetical protein
VAFVALASSATESRWIVIASSGQARVSTNVLGVCVTRQQCHDRVLAASDRYTARWASSVLVAASNFGQAVALGVSSARLRSN